MKVDSTDLDKVINDIRAQYGAEAVHAGSSNMEDLIRIPTGSYELDYATGGGVPLGRYSRFYGNWSSGKSLTCWNLIAEAQRMGLTCAYYNIEKQFDPKFTASRGVNLDDLVVMEGTQIEDVGVKLDAMLPVCNIHVLDSCSQAVSVDELAADADEWRPGIGPRAWGRVWRRVGERFNDRENAIILVDQVRSNWATKVDEPPGGKMMEFVSSLTLQFKRTKWLHRDKNGFLAEKGSDTKNIANLNVPAGIEIQVMVRKSRVGRQFRQARLYLDLDTKDFDHLYEMEKGSTEFGVVERNGAWFGLPNGESVQGRAALRAAIEADEVLQGYIRDAMEVAGSQ